MTDTWSLFDEARKVPCPRCEALPNEECRTISGKHAPMHAARFRPLEEAFYRGWSAGYDTATADVDT